MDWSKTVHEACPRESEECPICTKASEDSKGRFGHSVYMVFLSIIENYGDDPYIDKDNKPHYFAKRLLALKPGQLEDYERLFEVAKKKEGSLRGLTLTLERGGGDTSPRTGKPVINDNGDMYEILTDEQLDEYYGNDEERDEKGQIVKAMNDNIMPYDYKQYFPRPSAADIAQRWPQLSVGVGSQADIDRTLRQGEDAPSRGRGGDRNSRVSRGGGRGEQEQPQGTTGARGRGRSVPAQDYDSDPPEEDGSAEDGANYSEPRGRGRAAAPPPAQGRGRAAPQAQEQPQGRGRAPLAGGTRGVPAGRGAPAGRSAAPVGRTRGQTTEQALDDDIPF
jgi:hypothetical protein